MSAASDLSASTTSDPLARMRVVLVRTSHPGNIGATARAMLTMGLDRLVLVAPRRFPDPAADARASGATAVLARATVVESRVDGVEPIRTLKTYRWDGAMHGVKFGQNAIVERPGLLEVGTRLASD